MEVGVVGAGPAGAGVAVGLRETDRRVTVFEARDAVGGRAVTRRRAGCTYDYGANYLTGGDERVDRLVTDLLDTGGLVDVTEPIWTFDGDGTIAPGEDRDEHRWTYEAGLARFVERLFAATDAAVHLDTAVGRLERTDPDTRTGGNSPAGWRAIDATDDGLGTFDELVLTGPAPRTAGLLAASDWEDPLRAELVAAARAVPFRTIYSAVLHYPFRLDRPWYALVNTDRAHDISWLSREACKTGHVPDGEELLVCQLAPDPSDQRVGQPPEEVAPAAARWTADLLGDDRLAGPDWVDGAAWRYALADGAIDEGVRTRAEARGLVCAGDWVAGEGRIHLAVRSGLAAADRLRG